jgi:hypothetical protein
VSRSRSFFKRLWNKLIRKVRYGWLAGLGRWLVSNRGVFATWDTFSKRRSRRWYDSNVGLCLQVWVLPSDSVAVSFSLWYFRFHNFDQMINLGLDIVISRCSFITSRFLLIWFVMCELGNRLFFILFWLFLCVDFFSARNSFMEFLIPTDIRLVRTYINLSSSGVFMLSMIWVMVGTFGLLGRTYFFKVYFDNFYWSSISHGTNPNNGVEPTLIWLSISFLFYRSNRRKRCHSCSLPLSCDKSSPSFSSLIFLMTFVRLNYDLNADFST